MSTALEVAACPHCHHPLPEGADPLTDAGSAFCRRCGLALRQPCPSCAATLATPEGEFTACPHCHTSFWGCADCGRLYHLDRTSCLNGYCPNKGNFWTSRFGTDVWDSRQGQRSIDFTLESSTDPLPGWLGGGAGRERRWPSLHASGLLISVQESGVIELWAEHGAPRPVEGDEFRETSVCLSRLDLGEGASGPPLRHGNHLVIVGTNSVCLLEMTSNPSLGSRLELPGAAAPLRAVSLPHSVLVASSEGFWEIDVLGRTVLHRTEASLSLGVDPMVDEEGRAIFASGEGAGSFLRYSEGGALEPLEAPAFSGQAEWSLQADRPLLFLRNSLAYLEGDAFVVVELPATVVARPLYDPTSERLYLLLSDNTARSCTTTGERFSFVCDLSGTPTTPPLKIGEKLFYGSDGRYLCSNEEAMLPRLNSPPWGELSYANGRLFGATREGVLFAFLL